MSNEHTASIRAPSSDDVEVVVYDFGGTGRPLMLSHATGFHGHCYLPIAQALGGRFHSWALDYRGHGLTSRPDDWQVVWERYGDDAVAAARAVLARTSDNHDRDNGLIGFGHSMGGAGLLMAAHAQPDLFDLIIAFEPIVFPPPAPGIDQLDSPLVAGARRRRAVFASFDEAYDNYAAKPPMMGFDPVALRNYVDHGFVATDEGVRLRCDPEHEARTFETGGVHRTWDLLPEITTPVVIVAGAPSEMSPAAIARPISELLPSARFIELDHLDHFGPMTHPAEMASLITSLVDEL